MLNNTLRTQELNIPALVLKKKKEKPVETSSWWQEDIQENQ